MSEERVEETPLHANLANRRPVEKMVSDLLTPLRAIPLRVVDDISLVVAKQEITPDVVVNHQVWVPQMKVEVLPATITDPKIKHHNLKTSPLILYHDQFVNPPNPELSLKGNTPPSASHRLIMILSIS